MSFSKRYGETQSGLDNLQFDLDQTGTFTLAAAGGGALPVPNAGIYNINVLQDILVGILAEFDQFHEAGHRLLIDAVLFFALEEYRNDIYKPIIGIEQDLDATGLDIDLNGPLDYVVNRDDRARLPDIDWNDYTNFTAAELRDRLYPFDSGNQAWRPYVDGFVIEAKRSLYYVGDYRKYEGQMLGELVAFAYDSRAAIGGAGYDLYVPGILTDGRFYTFYELYMPAEDINGVRDCTYEVSDNYLIDDHLNIIVETIQQLFVQSYDFHNSKFR